MKVANRVAIVTGAGGGIGQAICRVLAENGATVVCLDFNRAAAESVAAALQAAGHTAVAMQADIRDFEACAQIASDTIAAYARIDILVNCAGITRDQLILTMSPEEWQAVIDTNLTGTFHCTKAVAQQMTFQKWGRIINISSVAGDRGGRGQSNYAASKGAVNAFTRSAAVELARKKVTVNAIAPGVIETEMSQEVVRRAKDEVLQHIPLKRLGTPTEIAALALFLASEDAGYITGQVLSVDGGFRG